MTKERRLGRGLEALLGQLPGWNGAAPPSAIPAESGAATIPIRPLDDSGGGAMPATGQQLKAAVTNDSAAAGWPILPIDGIKHNPHQPRQDFDADEIQRLADSIRAWTAATGRRSAVGGRIPAYRGRAAIAAQPGLPGGRRCRSQSSKPTSARRLNWRSSKTCSARTSAHGEGGIVPAVSRTIRWHEEELAARLKLDHSTVSNLIRLLELPKVVQDAVRRGTITPGHARALLPLGEEREQIAFSERIARKGLICPADRDACPRGGRCRGRQ